MLIKAEVQNRMEAIKYPFISISIMILILNYYIRVTIADLGLLQLFFNKKFAQSN